MFEPSRKSPERLRAVERLTAWTRERFGLPGAAVISVSEIACALPGCPPLETVIAFWTEDGKRHRFKVFKPLEQVILDDLPFAWLKDALAVLDGFDGECC